MIVLLGGVSGAGKDTVKKAIIERMEDVVSIPSITDRAMRPGEEEGVTYYYVTTEEFKKMIDEGELYEYDFHHEHYYGTSKKIINKKIAEGKVIIKDIDVNGIENLVKIFKGEVKVVTIFLRVPREELRRRLKNRSDDLSDEEIDIRLSRLEYEESKIPNFDYVIDNLDLEKTLDQVEEIINKERA